MAKPYKVLKKAGRYRFKEGTAEKYLVFELVIETAGGTTFPYAISEDDWDKAEEILTKKAQSIDAVK